MRWIRTLLRALPVALGVMVVIGLGVLTLVRVGRTVEAPGEVRVYHYDVVRPRAAGIVTGVQVEPGELVEAGQVLFELRDIDLERQHVDVRTRLDEALQKRRSLVRRRFRLRDEIHPLQQTQQSNLVSDSRLQAEASASRSRELELELERSRESFERMEGLHEAGLISAQELAERRFEKLQIEERYQQSLLEAQLAEKRIAGARDDLNLLRAEHRQALEQVVDELEQTDLQVEQLRADLARLGEISAGFELRAAMDGVLVGEPVNDLLGRQVQPGEELSYIIDLESVHFVTYVPEAAILKVRPGQEAYVELAGLPKRAFDVFEGEVQSVAERPEGGTADQEGILYPVEIRLSQPWVVWEGDRTYVRSGMRGRAKIAYQEDVSVLRAIYEALVGEPGPAPVGGGGGSSS